MMLYTRSDLLSACVLAAEIIGDLWDTEAVPVVIKRELSHIMDIPHLLSQLADFAATLEMMLAVSEF